jgi:Na+/glutamate symporter
MFVTAFIRPDKYMLKTENKSTPHVWFSIQLVIWIIVLFMIDCFVFCLDYKFEKFCMGHVKNSFD